MHFSGTATDLGELRGPQGDAQRGVVSLDLRGGEVTAQVKLNGKGLIDLSKPQPES